MVVLTAGVVSVIIKTPLAEAAKHPLNTATAAGGATGVIQGVPSGGATATAVAGSAGAGAVLGAMSSAVTMAMVRSDSTVPAPTTGEVLQATVTGAGVGGSAAAAVTSAAAGSAGLVAVAPTAGVWKRAASAARLLAAPAGFLTLGASDKPTTVAYTFVCWKQVVHDVSPEPSSGRLLREIVMDPRVKQVIISDDKSPFPEIILENIWDEKFRIEYVLLSSNKLAAHAVLLSPEYVVTVAEHF